MNTNKEANNNSSKVPTFLSNFSLWASSSTVQISTAHQFFAKLLTKFYENQSTHINIIAKKQLQK